MTDACVAEPTLRVVRVEAANPTSPGDIVVGDQSFCVRATNDGAKPRVYTVTLEAEDRAGNTAQIRRRITVPGSSSLPCASPDTLPRVADDDPACVHGGEPEPPPPATCTCRSAPGAGRGHGLPVVLALLLMGVVWIRRARA